MEPPIIIVGAGISGLVLAQYLHKSQIPFLIFDRDASITARSGGWGLTLHWSLPALKELLPEHIVLRLDETFVNKDAALDGDVGRFQFFNLKTGIPLYEVPATERIRVNRTKFRELLVTGIDVQWSKSLTTFESKDDSVVVYFEDGTSRRGQLLVACDGSHSRIRKIVYPESHHMNRLPIQLLGAGVQLSADQAAPARAIDPFFFQGAHPDSNVFLYFSFLDTPTKSNSHRQDYECQVIVSWPESMTIRVPDTNAERVALMKSLTADWAEPFRSIVQYIPADTEARFITIEDWIFNPGENLHPRVALLGDAAHSMTMYRGEGANNAIVDVFDFVQNVVLASLSTASPESVHKSIRAFEASIYERAKNSVLNSRQACLDAHDFARIADSPLVTRRTKT